MAQIMFGSGRLYGVRTDVVNATPVPFAVLQEATLDMTFTTKELYGEKQFPIFVARGAAKWTLKAKMGVISGRAFNDFFLGQTLATGQLASAMAEAGAVPAASTYTVTVANSATFAQDFGVVYAASGLPLTKVASAPAVGQYSVAAGVYTFAAADANAAVQLSYTYTLAGTGQKIAITNQLLGTTPLFGGVFRNRDPKTGLFSTYVFNRMTSSKLSLGSKTEDYMMPDFDIQIMADDSDQVGTISLGDAS